MKRNHSRFLIPGILLLGVVLRAPFTTLSTVLSDIAASFGVEVSSLGLLTSLPLLTFAIFSPFATSWARRFGIERLFLGVLILMTIGSALRTINLPLLYVGTLLIGAAIAFINVLLPSLIQANEPKRLGFLTTLCSYHSSHLLARSGLGADSRLCARSCDLGPQCSSQSLFEKKLFF